MAEQRLLIEPRPRRIDALAAQQVGLDGEHVLGPATLAKDIAAWPQPLHPVTLFMRA